MEASHDQTKPMTFYPTLEELARFDQYVAGLESQGVHKAGVAKIVPPKNWVARKAGYDLADVNKEIKNPVKQITSSLKVTPGGFITQNKQSSSSLSLPEYHRLATSPKHLPPSHTSQDELEQLYWKEVTEDKSPKVTSRAELQATLTDASQTVFNMARLSSILSEEAPESCLPRFSVGKWKTTSCWQVEDRDLYAVNFLHHGTSKTWYCVSPQYGYKLEQVAHQLFAGESGSCFNLLRHKNIMISPKLLLANDIPVNKVEQEQGTLLVFFPHAYHSGFDHGFSMAEETNFALPRWVEYGKRFRDCLCTNMERPVSFKIDKFVKKFQPGNLASWQQGEDFALHPEDPVFVKRYWVDLKTRLRLGFITHKEFGLLRESLSLKREVAPWFKEKFPNLDYNDNFELASKSKKTDHYPHTPVKKLKVDKHVDGKKKLGSIREEAVKEKHWKDLESKKTKKKIVESVTKGFGFKGENFEDLKAKRSLFQCPSNKKHKFKACKTCSGCMEKDCDACVYCLDKPRNGGKLVLKQKCKKRVCESPKMGTCPMCRLQV